MKEKEWNLVLKGEYQLQWDVGEGTPARKIGMSKSTEV